METARRPSAILLVGEEFIQRQPSFAEIAPEHRIVILKWAKALANDSRFQDLVRTHREKMIQAENPTDVKKTLDDMNLNISNIEMGNTFGHEGEVERIGEWMPSGAIKCALDAVWQATVLFLPVYAS